MKEVSAHQVEIDGGFWGERLALNATVAIDHQWDMLEQTGCIENFRIAAGRSGAFRVGFFFADSDAYKWLEAACRIYKDAPNDRLRERIDALAELIRAVQTPDGYLFTYNQIHFPGQRWVNLPVEHELYCLGHLIEACISHEEIFGNGELLAVAQRVADLLVADFANAGPTAVCGHEEVELALWRLHRATGEERYLELARRLVARRGRDPLVTWHNWQAIRSHGRRRRRIEAARDAYRQGHGGKGLAKLPPDNATPKPRFAHQRYLLSGLSGKYMQADRPVATRHEPVGHAVRFGYLQTAAAMLSRAGRGDEWKPALEQSWNTMVQRRMYVTGGLGSQPSIEGFGRDYELDPEYGYNETCAALASMLWSHEMELLTGQPKYADLFEWQLYNASLVGLGENGDSYFYNNPLRCGGGVTRQPWFLVPCCPSNLSRIWARLGEYVYAVDGDALIIYQFVTNVLKEEADAPLRVRMTSGLPWDGRITVEILDTQSETRRLRFRVPSWASGCRVTQDGRPVAVTEVVGAMAVGTASGYSPYATRLAEVDEQLDAGDQLEIGFDMPVRVLRSDPRVGARSKGLTLTRGPLAYCLESADNPGLDLLTATIDVRSVEVTWDERLFGGLTVLRGRTIDGKSFTAIPYYCWGNRGESQLNVVLRD
jgi:uncharacterized protein